MSKLNYPLKYIKLKNKATTNEFNSIKELGKELVCAYI